MREENQLYVIPELTTIATADNIRGLRKSVGDIPKLKDVLIQLKKDLAEIGIKEWEATIETHLTIGTSSVIPGGEAGIKTTLTFSGENK
jgi:hypothetical protein